MTDPADCLRFQARLYDEDARQALLAGAVPADLGDHLAGCAECRAEWSAAREDALFLGEVLEDAPPPHLRVAIAQTWTESRAARLRGLDWAAALSWAGGAGALAAGALQALSSSLSMSWSAAAFALAATGAFAVQITAAALSDAYSGGA